MQYKVYKLNFLNGVHFGKTSLEDGVNTFSADTLFSALCQEAIAYGEGKLDELVDLVKKDRLCFSDAFPYTGTEYYIPKPMLSLEITQKIGDSVTKKAFKNLKYIECNKLEDYLMGTYRVNDERPIDELGNYFLKVGVAIRGEELPQPFRVGTYYFHKGNGLYIIVGYKDEDALEIAETLLDNLSLSGIGGKRTSGLGRFDLLKGIIDSDLEKRIGQVGKKYMTLSISLPQEGELKNAIIDAQYMLKKRSGFVASTNYAKEYTRKRDLYMFAAGACFSNKYSGDIYDVSNGGNHPVYRYAKPLFMQLL